jgi:pimeloyl-ACP methyl ester carboxylesterase
MLYRAGEGEPVVLLHGATASWRQWRPVLADLVAHFEVIAPTLAGHDGGPSFSADVPLSVAGVADLLERHLDELDVGTAHFVGNSLGGALVPDDYASGGHYLVTAAKDADTGVEERFTCNVVLNRFVGGGQDSGSFSVSDLLTGRSNYFLVPSVTYAPGDSVAVSCRADDGSGGTTANDLVWLEQIRFRYIASQ